MTWRVVPFEPWHLQQLDPQPAQRELVTDRTALGASLASTGRCFTLLRASDRTPMCCGGAVSTHRDYATLWAAFACDARPAMLAIERRARRFIGMLHERRIDAAVRADHAAGRRWAERLGLRPEAQLGAYFDDGGDAVIYRLERN